MGEFNGVCTCSNGVCEHGDVHILGLWGRTRWELWGVGHTGGLIPNHVLGRSAVSALGVIGNTQRSVLGCLYPVKITFP